MKFANTKKRKTESKLKQHGLTRTPMRRGTTMFEPKDISFCSNVSNTQINKFALRK